MDIRLDILGMNLECVWATPTWCLSLWGYIGVGLLNWYIGYIGYIWAVHQLECAWVCMCLKAAQPAAVCLGEVCQA